MLGAFSHVGTRGAPVLLSPTTAASHSLSGRSEPHNAAATGDFLIENWQTIVLSKGCYMHTVFNISFFNAQLLIANSFLAPFDHLTSALLWGSYFNVLFGEVIN